MEGRKGERKEEDDLLSSWHSRAGETRGHGLVHGSLFLSIHESAPCGIAASHILIYRRKSGI
jgi:hypothetical protein